MTYARAGMYAGDELVDGLLPEDDQAGIVEDALIHRLPKATPLDRYWLASTRSKPR